MNVPVGAGIIFVCASVAEPFVRVSNLPLKPPLALAPVAYVSILPPEPLPSLVA
jgi:hypothetical protein